MFSCIFWSKIEKCDIAAVAALPYAWNKLKNSTILISGGSGFIGSHLIAVLEERNKVYRDNIKVISLSRQLHQSNSNVLYLQQDIEKEFDIDFDVDYIVHLASNTHPVQYAADPVGTIRTNIIGCENLLKLAVKKQVKRFVLASSVEIYGDGACGPMNESYCGYIDCNTARAGYNESKRLSESLCQAYFKQYGVDFVTARFARVFGADRKADSKAMAQFIDKAVGGEDIVLKSDGKQRYSYCYIMDAVSGLLKILTDGVSGEAYNIADDDNGFTLCNYAEYIANLVGRQVVFDLNNRQDGASKIVSALLDCTKLKALGWSPMYSILDGIDKTYFIKNNLRH